MMGYVIGGLIAVYVVYVVVRRVKDIRAGKYCNCSEGCGSCGKCQQKKKQKE